MNLVLSADSFADHASLQIGFIALLLNLSSLLIKEKASLIGLPKTISAGDILQSGSGVFLSCSNALRNLSLSRLPDGLMLDLSKRLADLTATSARPFDCGWYADDFL